MDKALPYLRSIRENDLDKTMLRDLEEELDNSSETEIGYKDLSHDSPDTFEFLYYSPSELQQNAQKSRTKAAAWRKAAIITSVVLLICMLALGFVFYLFQESRDGYTVVGPAQGPDMTNWSSIEKWQE